MAHLIQVVPGRFLVLLELLVEVRVGVRGVVGRGRGREGERVVVNFRIRVNAEVVVPLSTVLQNGAHLTKDLLRC